ncbi:MAG: hypothetical protein EPO21_21995 [Chloroflexota bacterium]|nr:MAG: hypothetical protein EPO21_21995 [Chloroflexota bacterium]
MTNRDPLGPARRMALFIAEIVAAASVLPPFVWNDSAVRCRRRPKNRRCSGRLRVREERTGEIAYQCSVCDRGGTVSGWRGTDYDLSSFRDERDEPRLELVLTEEEYDLLRRCLLMLDQETMALISGATFSPAGIVLRASVEDLEILEGDIASEENHTPNRRKQRTLDGILRRIAMVLRPPAPYSPLLQ